MYRNIIFIFSFIVFSSLCLFSCEAQKDMIEGGMHSGNIGKLKADQHNAKLTRAAESVQDHDSGDGEEE